MVEYTLFKFEPSLNMLEPPLNMDRFFVEEERDGQYRIALVDRRKIFAASTPGLLANVFECPLEQPSITDRAEIFYALAPEIGATDWEADLRETHRSIRLNHWSIRTQDSGSISIQSKPISIFNLIQPLTDADRIALYAVPHSITPSESIQSPSQPWINSKIQENSSWINSKIQEDSSWKTGILQRCIDCLVSPPYRKRAVIYTAIDKVYRQLLRYTLETAHPDPTTPDLKLLETESSGSRLLETESSGSGLLETESSGSGLLETESSGSGLLETESSGSGLLELVRQLITSMGLRHSHDVGVITFSDATWTLFDLIQSKVNRKFNGDSQISKLSQFLQRWSGATILESAGICHLAVNPDVTRCLAYLDPLLPQPATLAIVDTPL